ncbi:MAG: C4-dicarboxylate TRAP transporter substrate-binding protein [Rhodospirillales bacterium]|nr:C4-dicarboxylate TRAP transporter substrate-binding protein [Rhodospirillales bacterium]
MKPLRFRTRLFAAAALIAGLALAPATQAQEAIKLTLVSGHPPAFLWVKHLQETFAPAVEKELAKTGKYKIEWNHAYGGTLAKVGGELETIEEGLADMGTSWSLFSAAKMPLQNVSYMAPFNSDQPKLIVAIIEDLQKKIPAMGAQWDKYNQVYLGGGVAIDPYHLFTNFPINKIEDMNGHKIGAPGPSANWLKGTGAVGVAGDLTTYYNSIKTNVFDGAIVFATAAVPAKLVEVAPHVTKINFGSPYAGGLTFNKTRWAKMPPEVQAAIRTGVAAYEEWYYVSLDQRVAGGYEAMEKAGAKIVAFPEDQRQKWAKQMPNVAKEWAEAQEAKGLPGKAVLAGFMEGLRARGLKPLRDWDKE